MQLKSTLVFSFLLPLETLVPNLSPFYTLIGDQGFSKGDVNFSPSWSLDCQLSTMTTINHLSFFLVVIGHLCQTTLTFISFYYTLDPNPGSHLLVPKQCLSTNRIGQFWSYIGFCILVRIRSSSFYPFVGTL